MTIRPISPDDLDLICRHRREMFRDAGQSQECLDALAEPFRQWLAPRLADGRYFGFIAEESGEAAGGIGLMEIDWPPHPAHPLDSRRGHVLNLFVEPAFRMHATAAGRPLYEKNGWGATPEMGKSLSSPR